MEDKIISILKNSVAAYKKTKFKNQVTSNNGEIDLNMCVNCSFLSQFLASVTLTFSRSSIT